MAFLDFLLGKKEKTQQFERYTPQQTQILDMLGGGAQQQLPEVFQFLSQILGQSPEALQAFERPAMRQFEQQVLPSIAERFTGQFGAGSQRSSGFGQQLGQAGAGLTENLAAQRAGLSMGAIEQLKSLLAPALGQRTDTVFRPAQGGALPGLLSLAGQAGGAYLGGPGGASMGGQFGTQLGSLLGR